MIAAAFDRRYAPASGRYRPQWEINQSSRQRQLLHHWMLYVPGELCFYLLISAGDRAAKRYIEESVRLYPATLNHAKPRPSRLEGF
jgi:hypothetical protein